MARCCRHARPKGQCTPNIPPWRARAAQANNSLVTGSHVRSMRSRSSPSSASRASASSTKSSLCRSHMSCASCCLACERGRTRCKMAACHGKVVACSAACRGQRKLGNTLRFSKQQTADSACAHALKPASARQQTSLCYHGTRTQQSTAAQRTSGCRARYALAVW